MKKSLYKKLIEYTIAFLCIISINFLIPRLMPGDPFTFLSSEDGYTTVIFSQNQIEEYKQYYGLDKPLHLQYASYIGNLFKGYLGYSIYYNEDVLPMVLKRSAWTIFLVIVSLAISSILGIVIGGISAWFRNRLFDRTAYFFMVVISEIPAFLIGIALLFFVAARFDLFPLSGGVTVFKDFESPIHWFFDIVLHSILPIATLVLTRLGGFYLLSRNSMISVLSKDYIITAKAKGLSKFRIVFRHAFKNAVIPVITRIFLSLGTVFGGAILVENVFKYPGVGTLMRDAVLYRDYALIQGIFLFVAVAVLVMNFLADVAYKKLDPRVA